MFEPLIGKRQWISGQRFRSVGAGVFLCVVVILTWGHLGIQEGLPDQQDIGTYLIAAYDATHLSAWGIWEDALFPGLPRHPTRNTIPYHAVAVMTRLLGNVTLSINLGILGGRLLACLAMHRYACAITGSQLAGVAAALVYTYVRISPNGNVSYLFGYALTPLVFLYLHRLIEKGKPEDLAWYAFFLSLVIMSTIVAYALVLVLMLVLYGALGLLLFCGDRPKDLFSRLLKWGGASLWAVFLSAYYLVPLLTLGTATAESGYDAAKIAAYSADSVLHAFAFSLPWEAYLQGTILDLLVCVVAVTSIGFGLMRRSRCGLLLVSTALFSLLIARGPNPPFTVVNQWIWEWLPYFQYFRPTSRPLIITAFCYSALFGSLIDVVWDEVSRSAKTCELGLKAAGGLGLLSLVAVYVAASYPKVQRELAPASPPSGLIEAYEAIGGDAGDFVFSGVPFLERRVSVSWADSLLQDPTKTYGTAFSGKSALGATAVGGISVGKEQVEPLLLFQQGLPEPGGIVQGGNVFISERPRSVFHRTLSDPNYVLDMHLRLPHQGPCQIEILGTEIQEDGSSSSRSTYQIVAEMAESRLDWFLHSQEQEYPGDRIHIGTTQVGRGSSTNVHVSVLRHQGMLYVKVGHAGELLVPLSSARSESRRIYVTVQSSGERTLIEQYSVVPLPTNLFTFAKFLALYDTKYVLIPPEERNGQGLVFGSVPGLSPHYELASGYSILGNELYQPSLYVPSRHVLVLGEMDSAMRRLAEIPTFRFEDSLLLPRTVAESAAWSDIAPLIDVVVADSTSSGDWHPECREGRYLFAADPFWRSTVRADSSVGSTSSFAPNLPEEGDYCLAVSSASVGGFSLSEATVMAHTDTDSPASLLAPDESDLERVFPLGARLGNTWLVSDRLRLHPGDVLTLTLESRGLLPEGVYLYQVDEQGCATPAALFSSSGFVDSQVLYSKIRPDRYSVHVDTEEPSFVVFLDRWHRLWQAQEGATRLPHVPAYNYANAFLLGSTGSHTVTVVFRGQALARAGRVAGLFAWLIMLAGGVLVPPNRRLGVH